MEQFVVGQAGVFLNGISVKSHEVNLLARNGDTEILIYKFDADARAMLEIADPSQNMEFFYIMSGQVVFDFDNTSRTLRQNEYFYVTNQQSKVYIKAETDATMLYVSTHPVYDTMKALAQQLEEISNKIKQKDLYTYEHNIRLRDYTLRIAEKMGMPTDNMDRLGFAARFHDVGKINVPDYILQKPGMLNEDEFRYIRQHPTDGKVIVSDTFLGKVGDIIEQHHERLDGSGYPLGLKDEDILLEARIIAVADSYDAMTTDRPYRKAMTPVQALYELERLAGVHYDKDIVEIFKSLLSEQGLIR